MAVCAALRTCSWWEWRRALFPTTSVVESGWHLVETEHLVFSVEAFLVYTLQQSSVSYHSKQRSEELGVNSVLISVATIG